MEIKSGTPLLAHASAQVHHKNAMEVPLMTQLIVHASATLPNHVLDKVHSTTQSMFVLANALQVQIVVLKHSIIISTSAIASVM